MKMSYLVFAGIIIFILNIILVRFLHLPQKTATAIYTFAAVLIFLGIAGSVLM